MLCLEFLCAIAMCLPHAPGTTDELYSGPQPGEVLPALEARLISPEDGQKQVAVTDEIGDRPFVIVFFHEKTRPAFGLTTTLFRFAETRPDLSRHLVFLTADPPQTEIWLNQVQPLLPKKTTIAISPDGIEGPGAWGLNRNVALTIVVGRNQKVEHSFALRQPAVDSDGPAILKAIVEVTGGGDVPDISDFTGPQGRMKAEGRPSQENPAEDKLRRFLRPVIQKDATPEAVAEAAKAVEEEMARDDNFRTAVKAACGRIIDSGRLANYGIPEAQEYIMAWAK